jgi:hypothetical protein
MPNFHIFNLWNVSSQNAIYPSLQFWEKKVEILMEMPKKSRFLQPRIIGKTISSIAHEICSGSMHYTCLF